MFYLPSSYEGIIIDCLSNKKDVLEMVCLLLLKDIVNWQYYAICYFKLKLFDIQDFPTQGIIYLIVAYRI